MNPYCIMFAGMGYMVPLVSWYIDQPFTMDVFTDQMVEAGMWGMEYFAYYEPFHEQLTTMANGKL